MKYHLIVSDFEVEVDEYTFNAVVGQISDTFEIYKRPKGVITDYCYIYDDMSLSSSCCSVRLFGWTEESH